MRRRCACAAVLLDRCDAARRTRTLPFLNLLIPAPEVSATFTDPKTSQTYCASSRRAARTAAAILAIRVLAAAGNVVANDLDAEVKLCGRGRRILENRQPCGTGAVTDTEVERSEVAPWVVLSAPLASVLDRDTLRVNVVLRGGVATLPVVVVVGVWAGEVASRAWLCVEWNGLSLSAWVVSAADSHVLAKLVLDQDGDLVSAPHAERLGHGRVGELQLAVLAKDTAN